MITIDHVKQGRGYWYHFPTIDFKFQNRGRATAFLWQFAIEIIQAEIDYTPVLNFKSDVNADALLIHVVNNGWGTADDCHIQLGEPTLDLLFSDSIRQYRGTTQSGESQSIFQFGTALADIKQFEIIKRQFKNLSFGYLNIRGLSLTTADVSWQCDDSQHKGKAQVRFQHHPVMETWWDIILTKFGFEKISYPDPCIYSPSISDTTYGAIIDPSVGPYEQKYPIARKIPSGDVERFHIMVGSPMSCHLQVRFKFFIDQTTIIESEPFDISIWNPRDSKWHMRYTDGSYTSRYYSFSEETQSDESIFPLKSDRDLFLDKLRKL
jgi:hypothetical protein